MDRGNAERHGGLSVLLSLLLHAEIDADASAPPRTSRAHRLSLSDQRRSAQFASFSPSPSVSVLVFEDGVAVDASTQTHAGPTASTQVKRLHNWMLEQQMNAPAAFTPHHRVLAQPALSAAQLRSRRTVCYAHNERDARSSCVAVCERVGLVPPGGGPDGLTALVAGAWSLAAPVMIFDDRYGADGFWDFLTETVRCGTNYFATASGIVVDVQMLAVPLNETHPIDEALTVDLLWAPGPGQDPSSGEVRKATAMCARDAAQLDVIVEKARLTEQALRARARVTHLVTSLLFFNHRTLRKASLTVVRLVADDAAVASARASRQNQREPSTASSANLLESLVTSATQDNLEDPSVTARYQSTRLTAALHKKVSHFVRAKEHENGALFHWICNVPCVSARRLPSQLDDQHMVEFRLCDDGDPRAAARQAARVVEALQRMQRAAQNNATEFTVLEPKRSSLTAERLSVYITAESLPNLT